MEQPITNSALPFTGTPTSINEINEMPPIRDTMVPPSLPSTEKERNQQTHIKSILPVRSYPAEEQSHTPQKDANKLHGTSCDSKRRAVPSFFSQAIAKNALPFQPSITDDRLAEIIKNLNENPIEDEVFGEEKLPLTGRFKFIRQSRRFLRHLMEQPTFHYIIIVLIIIDLIVVFIDLTITQLSVACLTDEEMVQYNITEQRADCLLPPTNQLETAELSLYYLSLVIICIFVLEIFTGFYSFGWRRYKKILFLLDAIVVLVSFILEVYFHFGNTGKIGSATAGLVVLRLWKIVRAIHAIAHSISLRNRMIIEQIKRARAILKEEKMRAEKKIHEQEIEIHNLMNLLAKTGTQGTPEQTNEFTRSSSKSLNPVVFF